VIDAFSRRVVGWSLDRRQREAMVNSGLGMAIEASRPTVGTVVHATVSMWVPVVPGLLDPHKRLTREDAGTGCRLGFLTRASD
jgi:hypothetical protein